MAGGRTVAVMGTGLDHTAPAIHRQVRTQIERTGLVFTPQVAFRARWGMGFVAG